MSHVEPLIDRLKRAARSEPFVLATVFLGGIVLVVSRLPDVLTNPQFYIEDGKEFYAQAHNLGVLGSLLETHRGYFVLVQQIGAIIALAFPLIWAPIVMGLFGAILDVLPAVIIVSRRMDHVFPNRWFRVCLAFVSLAAPNAWTLMGNTTNGMWYLGFAAALLIVAKPPTTRCGRALDLGVIVVSGLSGPFSVLTAPIALAAWLRTRARWAITLLVVTASLAAVQMTRVLLTPRPPRGAMPTGASPGRLARLLVYRVVYETMFGQVGGQHIFAGEWGPIWSSWTVLASAGLIALALLVYALLKAPWELRFIVLFAAVTLGASLSWPGDAEPSGVTWWALLTPASNGNRYFLIPVVVSMWLAAWIVVGTHARLARVVAGAFLAVALIVGVVPNWREPRRPDFNFDDAVRRYAAAPANERVLIATPPDWVMSLTKLPGETVHVPPSDCGAETDVPAGILAQNQMQWNGPTGTVVGTDPYVLFGFPSRVHACEVSLRVVVQTPAMQPLFVQLFWTDTSRFDFSADERNGFVFVVPSASEQIVRFRVNDTIDRIRIDPGSMQGTTFRLDGVTISAPVDR